jgi:glycosyltransferase involved in cell wall biosynthesis
MYTRYLRRFYVPVIGKAVDVPLYLASLMRHRDLLGWADVIFGSWAYPEGCAAVIAARTLRKPCAVMTVGSDVNVLAQQRAPGEILRRVLPKADALIAVSRPMCKELEKLGGSEERIHLVPNGVDRTIFGRHDRVGARKALGLDTVPGPLILFVGRLEPQKGFAELLQAFDRVHPVRPDVTLALVGDGVSRPDAEAARARFNGRLLVIGEKPLAEVALWMAASDLLTLPSYSEGTPNVILEALASGCPVVATRVGGIPDVLADPRSGILIAPRDAGALEDGWLEALRRSWNADEVRACGPVTWDESAAALARILESIR